jgi:two-component system sensor histidine kinase KdpD
MLAFNFFFLPPIGTLTIADPNNWVALIAFLVVSIVASRLSASARARARDALERRNELARLFDLTRDILLTTEGEGALTALAGHIARRFELSGVRISVPDDRGGWRAIEGGADTHVVPEQELERTLVAARGVVEFDARTRSYGGHRTLPGAEASITLVPIRIGTEPIGVLSIGDRRLEPGTLDAIAGIVAIAAERSQLLEARRAAELQRQRAELSSALLASLSHDLRTPLTAIRVAVSNVLDGALTADERATQARLALEQLQHLGRLFQDILDMAKIEARAVRAERQWVTPADVVEAAVANIGRALEQHRLTLDTDATTSVDVDPRLTSAALSHLLENASQYAPAGSTIRVEANVAQGELRISVADEGPGLRPEQMERLFEPFFRGDAAQPGVPGTGMGLAITRGLLAAEGGRVWSENVSPHGARFTLAVPARTRVVMAASEES